MFVGHALLAFAVATLVADWRGVRRERALAIGVVAGAFAAVPDVDVAYAVVGLLDWVAAGGAIEPTAAFWDASRGVHRSLTHSVVVAALATPAFGLLAVRDRSARTTAALAGGWFALLVAGAFVLEGALAAFVLASFAVAGAVVSRLAVRYSTLSTRTITLAAAFGLLSHPWGDFVTGDAPAWTFPFPRPFLDARVPLHDDATLHLLGAFALELAVVWLAVLTYVRLTDAGVFAGIDRRASAGATYGVAALAVTPPTLEVSYHFVFSILAVGLVCGAIWTPSSRPNPNPGESFARRPRVGLPSEAWLINGVLTALSAVTVALLAYAVVYGVVVLG